MPLCFKVYSSPFALEAMTLRIDRACQDDFFHFLFICFFHDGCSGTPSEEDWPGVGNLPDYNRIRFKPQPRPNLQAVFSGLKPQEFDLLFSFLQLNPNKRRTASEALKHQFFVDEPAPTEPSSLVLPVEQGAQS